MLCLHNLQVIAWDQPGVAIAPLDFGLPPAVILMAKDGEKITLAKAKLLWDRGLVHV